MSKHSLQIGKQAYLAIYAPVVDIYFPDNKKLKIYENFFENANNEGVSEALNKIKEIISESREFIVDKEKSGLDISGMAKDKADANANTHAFLIEKTKELSKHFDVINRALQSSNSQNKPAKYEIYKIGGTGPNKLWNLLSIRKEKNINAVIIGPIGNPDIEENQGLPKFSEICKNYYKKNGINFIELSEDTNNTVTAHNFVFGKDFFEKEDNYSKDKFILKSGEFSNPNVKIAAVDKKWFEKFKQPLLKAVSECRYFFLEGNFGLKIGKENYKEVHNSIGKKTNENSDTSHNVYSPPTDVNALLTEENFRKTELEALSKTNCEFIAMNESEALALFSDKIDEGITSDEIKKISKEGFDNPKFQKMLGEVSKIMAEKEQKMIEENNNSNALFVEPICIITFGDKGSFLVDSKDHIFCEPQKVENIVDVTGAGDSFAATAFALRNYFWVNRRENEHKGKLINYENGIFRLKNEEKIAILKGATNVASEVIQHFGAQIEDTKVFDAAMSVIEVPAKGESASAPEIPAPNKRRE